MTGTGLKICYACRWAEHVKFKSDFAWCRRPNRQLGAPTSLVSGMDLTKQRVSCQLERGESSAGADNCGPDARYFEPFPKGGRDVEGA